MLECVQLPLKEREVELAVAVWTNLDKLRDQEGCVSVFVLAHAVLVATEQLDDRLEEVGANVTDGVRREVLRQQTLRGGVSSPTWPSLHLGCVM